jgi:hypothetical protein
MNWDLDTIFILFYTWVLTMMAGTFLGHELTIMKYHLDRQAHNRQMESCNRIITGLAR